MHSLVQVSLSQFMDQTNPLAEVTHKDVFHLLVLEAYQEIELDLR